MGLRWAGFTALAAGCAALLIACGAGGKRPAGPRLVILYAPCTLNRSYLAPYEPAVTFTPELAAFARESVVFRRHNAESGQSGTDFAALFTGTQAYEHGVYFHPSILREDLQLVTETFAQAGYETFFWSKHPMASAELGYGQGVPPEHVVSARSLRKKLMLQESDPDFRDLLDGLAADPGRHAFVLANFTMTHGPYPKQLSDGAVERFLAAHPERASGVTPDEVRRWVPVYEEHRLGLEWDFPATIERMGLSAPEVERLAAVLEVVYEAAVAQLDAAFGQMLAAVRQRGLEDEALIAFTADHGELLRRDNALFQWTHGLELTPEVLHVPLLIHCPGLPAGDYEGVTRSIDVYPTLAGLCGVEIPAAHPPEGVDLAPVLRGERAAPELLAFSHSTVVSAEHLENFRDFQLVKRYFPRTDPELIWVRVRKGDLVAKLRNLDGTRFGFEVFDLARDPHETANLYDPSSSEQALLVEELERYKRRLVENFGRQGEGGEISEEERLERLRDLGYVR